MSQARTYRAWGFVCCYYGVLLVIVAGWFSIVDALGIRIFGTVIFIAGGLLGLPLTWAKVEVGDEGITQQVFRRWSVRWAEVVTWERLADSNSDGPDVITINTRTGSFTLNHNLIYGRRLNEIESELKRRIAKPNDATRASQ